MSNNANVQPTWVAILLFRHSARHIPEYLLVQDSSTSNRVWLLPTGPIALGVAPQLAAQHLVEQLAGNATHGPVVPADYRCSLPLWGSQVAANGTESAGYEEAFMAEIRAQDGEPHLNTATYSAFQWVPVIDAVSMLRYPEHVEALLRSSSKLEAKS